MFLRARIYLLIYAGVIGLAIYHRSILPLMFVGLPTFYGSWLTQIYGNTQHAGLAENVLDHRLNCRTVYMNRINRFLYWNMNYHVEHHMFPLVPYHNLPRLHELVKADMPTPYASTFEAWRELLAGRAAAGERPGLPRQTQAAYTDHPHRCPGHGAYLHRKGPAGERLGGSLREPLPEGGGRHPLRSRPEDLRHLPHRPKGSFTPPMAFAPTATHTSRTDSSKAG